MARLPAPEDYGVSIPRASRGVVDVPVAMQHTTRQTPTEVRPDVYTGEALQQAGKMFFDTIEQRTAKMEALRKQEQDKLDTLKAQDALNQIRQARLDLTMGDTGAYKITGGNVLSPTYMSGYKDQLNTKVTGIMANLSPAQQAMLKPHADHEIFGLQSDILRHSMGETEKFKGIVRQGNIDTLTSLGTSFWNDPGKMTEQQMLIDQQVMQQAQEAGLTSDTPEGQNAIMALRRKAMSPMLVGSIASALDNRDLRRAKEIFNENQLTIDPDKKLIIAEQLAKREDAQAAQNGAASYLTDSVYPKQTVVGKLSSVILGGALDVGEVGAARAKDKSGAGVNIRGPFITSGPNKGQRAVGTHQLMPDSAKQDAAEAGIPWDEKLFFSATPEGQQYHDALQQAHLARLMKMFSSAPEIAAAYNAGEGNVIEAKKKYAKAMEVLAAGGKPVLPGGYSPERDGPLSFLDFLPKPRETKPYVSRVLAAVKAQPDMVAPSKQEIESSMAVRFAGRPDLAAEAAKQVEHSIDLMKDARKSEVEKTQETLYGYMAQGKSYQELPVSELSKLPVVEQDKMRKVFDEHISGAPRDSNQGLLMQINSDPNYLARVPNAAWVGPMKTQLSAYDWDRFDKQRSSLLGGNVKESEGMDAGSVKAALDARLNMLNIDSNPGDKDPKGRMRVNSARAILDQAVLERQKQIGRKLTDVEVIKLVNDTFSHNTILQNTFFGITLPSWAPGSGKHALNIMSMQYSDVPSADRDSLKAKLKAGGVTDPTDVQVLTLYKQLQMGMK